MIHNFISHDVGEWWDEYICTQCGKKLVTQAEDLFTVKHLNESSECSNLLVGSSDHSPTL